MRSKAILIAVAILAAAGGVISARLLGAGAGILNLPDFVAVPSRPSRAWPGHVIDLSDTYGRVNLTIFNKKTRVVFAKPQEFFSDSGVHSFDHVRFDDVGYLPRDLRLVDGRRLTSQDIVLIEDEP